jgi:internalin A
MPKKPLPVLTEIRRARTDKLTELQLHSREIASLPPEIGTVSTLTSLSLFNNALTTVPREIGQLTNLRRLFLTGNYLTELPPEIGALQKLEVLALGTNPELIHDQTLSKDTYNAYRFQCSNDFPTLPAVIGELRGLKFLDVSSSRLQELPDFIGDLTELRGLDLSGNKLTKLPESMARLTNLTYLDLRKNPLPVPPEILDGVDRPAEILNYYFSIQTGASRALNEAKVLIVGQGGVGKTSLKRYLLNDTKCAPGELPTEGIDITDWKVANDRPEAPLTVHVWDFGGQEIMHATHQFFLTRRSLYILVIDARSGEKESNIHYWLEIIRSYGGDSPVLVVVNKCDLHPHELNETRLMRDFPSIRAFASVSCATGLGIAELRQTIHARIRKLPHLSDQLPSNYFRIKQAMAQKAADANFVPIEEYQQVCRDNGLTDQEEQARLIRFLHDLGIVLNFQDPNDPYSLNDPYVLNPEWVTQGVYAILNDHELKTTRDGVLTRSRLRAILNARAGYPESRHDFIVRKMCQFELAFEGERTRGREQTWLVPELLDPKEPTALAWNESNALNFYYDYSVLPAGVICRFIVRMQRLVQPDKCWRSGAVLSIDDCAVFVRGDIEKSRVFIAVQGPIRQRREKLAVVRDAFQHIHSTIPGLTVDEMVSLPDDPGVAVRYRHLLTLEELEQPSFVPEGARRVYQVRELLNGVDSATYRRRRRATAQAERGARASDEKHVFVSYCHDNKEAVGMLVADLEAAGELVWWDEFILGGQDWKGAIRTAMRDAYAVIVCLSTELTRDRYRSGVYPELSDAIATYRQYAHGRAFIFPVRLDDCEIPLIEIDDTRTLDRLQHIDLFPAASRAKGIQKLLQSLAAAPGHT